MQLVDTQLGTGSQARPPVRDARSRLRLYLARLSKTYLSVRPGPVSVTAEVLRPDASRARSGHQEHRPPSTLGLGFCRDASCFSLHALASPSRRSQPNNILQCCVCRNERKYPARVGPRDVGARGVRSGRPTRDHGRTGTHEPTLVRAPTALCGLARTDKQHKRRARRAHYQSIEASFYA